MCSISVSCTSTSVIALKKTLNCDSATSFKSYLQVNHWCCFSSSCLTTKCSSTATCKTSVQIVFEVRIWTASSHESNMGLHDKHPQALSIFFSTRFCSTEEIHVVWDLTKVFMIFEVDMIINDAMQYTVQSLTYLHISACIKAYQLWYDLLCTDFSK